MSWIADLAGKAEDFLVKIDQNAAVAAQAVKTKEKTTSSNHHSRNSSVASVTSDASPFNNFPLSGTLTPTNVKSSPSMSDLSKAVGSKSSSKLDRDAALMASLNLNGNKIPSESQELQNGDLSLQQENNLLKQEIKSLSQEIRQAMQSAKTAEKGILNDNFHLIIQFFVVFLNINGILFFPEFKNNFHLFYFFR